MADCLFFISNVVLIVCKGVPALRLKAPTPEPGCPYFQIFVSLPFFMFHSILRYFREFPPTSCYSLHLNPTNQSFLVQTNIQFNCRFLSKIDFQYFKPLFKQVILIYGIFSDSFLGTCPFFPELKSLHLANFW